MKRRKQVKNRIEQRTADRKHARRRQRHYFRIANKVRKIRPVKEKEAVQTETE